MKRFFGAVMMLLAFGMANAQNKTDKNGQKQGAWTKYYDNGQVMYSGKFVNDKPVGEFVRYYDDGKPKLKQNFDAKTGEVYTELYKPDGKMLQKGTYKDEKKIGEWITYSQKGEVMQTEHYSQNGLLDGTTTVYDADGRVFETIEWTNGKKNGSHIQYFPNGQKQSDVKYVNGMRQGECISYFDDGHVEMKGQYANDKKSGLWVVYDRDGSTILEQVTYVNGVPDNEVEQEKKEQEEVKQNDENAGKIKDPAQYQNTPSEYFNETQSESSSAAKGKKKK